MTMARTRDRASKEPVEATDAAQRARPDPTKVEDPNRIGEGAIDARDGRAAPSEEDLSSKTDFEGVPDPASRAGGDGEAFDPHDLDLTPVHDGRFAGDSDLGGDPFGLDVDGDALTAESHGGVPDLPGAGNSVADLFDAGLDTEVPAEYSLAGNETGQTAANPAPPGYVMLDNGEIVPKDSDAAKGGGTTTSLLEERLEATATGALDDDGQDDDGATGVGATGKGFWDWVTGEDPEDEQETTNTEKAEEVQQQKEQEQLEEEQQDEPEPDEPKNDGSEPTEPQGDADDGSDVGADDQDPPTDATAVAGDYDPESGQNFGRSPSMDDEIGETYFEIQQGALGGSEVQYADQPSSGGSEPLDYDGVDYGGEKLQPVEDIPADVVTAALYNGGDIDPHEDPTASFTGVDDSADAATAAADDGGDAAEVMEG
jgi:hypothetical protein